MDREIKNTKRSMATPVILAVIALAFSVLSVILLDGAFSLLFSMLAAAALAVSILASSSYLFLLAAPITYIAALAILRDPLAALGAVEYAPIAFIAASAYKNKCSAVGIICRISAVTAVFEAAMFALTFVSLYGELNAEVFAAFIGELHTLITDTLYELFVLPLKLEALFTYETLGGLVTYTLILSPSVFITVYNITALCLCGVIRLLCRRLKCGEVISPESKHFAISRIAAILFIVAYIITVFIGGEYVSAFYAVAANLVIILAPGLALFGMIDFLSRSGGNSSKRAFTIIAMVFLFFVATALFFLLAAFGGAWATLTKANKNKLDGGNYAP